MPRKAVAKTQVVGYPQTTLAEDDPAIRLPDAEHATITKLQSQNKVARSQMTANQLLKEDIDMLRTHTNAPETAIEKLKNMNKQKYGITPYLLIEKMPSGIQLVDILNKNVNDMDRKIRVLMPFEIPLLDQEVDMNVVKHELNDYVKNLVLNVNIEDLEDWKLLLSVVSRSTNKIGLFKRVKRYPSDKEFEISISIPIPNDDEAKYGLAKVKDSYYLPLNDKNFDALNPYFEDYSSLYAYILESSKRAIALAFTKGFICNGKKIILKKQG